MLADVALVHEVPLSFPTHQRLFSKPENSLFRVSLSFSLGNALIYPAIKDNLHRKWSAQSRGWQLCCTYFQLIRNQLHLPLIGASRRQRKTIHHPASQCKAPSAKRPLIMSTAHPNQSGLLKSVRRATYEMGRIPGHILFWRHASAVRTDRVSSPFQSETRVRAHTQTHSKQHNCCLECVSADELTDGSALASGPALYLQAVLRDGLKPVLIESWLKINPL